LYKYVVLAKRRDGLTVRLKCFLPNLLFGPWSRVMPLIWQPGKHSTNNSAPLVQPLFSDTWAFLEAAFRAQLAAEWS
jgi:hypothetical protein